MKAFLVLQHHPVETPGVFAAVLAERGLAAQTIRPHFGHSLPLGPDAFAGVIAMGGPMGVYEEDRYPCLLQIRLALKEGPCVSRPHKDRAFELGQDLGVHRPVRTLAHRTRAFPNREEENPCESFGQWQPL